MERQTKTKQKKKLTAVRLVRFVFAVWISITLPRQTHTLAVGTAKFPSCAVRPAVGQDAVPTTALWPLVWIVRTVRVSVAAPHERHTLRGVTAEMVGPAGQRGRALELIAAVSTVIVTVAHIDGGQALAVGTHELPAGTGLGIYRINRKKINFRKKIKKKNTEARTKRHFSLCSQCLK